MKKFVSVFLMAMLVLFTHRAESCVGKTLYIGAPDSANEMLLAEMVSLLVNERTGTTVKVIYYKDSREMYKAVKKGEVGMVIENADQALQILNRPKESNPRLAYEISKKEYRKDFNLVWLEPFGGSHFYAPVISVETISNLPALPKLINKLSGILNDEAYARVVKNARPDEKPRKIARDYLKAKKLI